MEKIELKSKIENWFEKGEGYFNKRNGCIDGYYDLEKLAEYILEEIKLTKNMEITKEGQTNYCEACEARGNGGLRHTCGIEPQIKQCERCGMTELDFVKKGILCDLKINNGQHTFQDIAPMGVSQSPKK